MIDTGPTLRCPHCRGPIGYWVIQPRFTCHHCGVVLMSNHRRVQWQLLLAALALWGLFAVLTSTWGSRPWHEALVLSGTVWLPVSAALGWWALRFGVRLTPEPPLVAAATLFAGWPGAPRPTASQAADRWGYHRVGDARAAVAMASRRPAVPDDPYDVDLILRALVWPDAQAAIAAMSAECTQDRQLARGREPLALPAGLAADECELWRFHDPAPSIVAVARHGDCVIRAVGRLHAEGLFPDPAAFIAALRAADRHLARTLSRGP